LGCPSQSATLSQMRQKPVSTHTQEPRKCNTVCACVHPKWE
jgi:hypothetical protein